MRTVFDVVADMKVARSVFEALESELSSICMKEFRRDHRIPDGTLPIMQNVSGKRALVTNFHVLNMFDLNPAVTPVGMLVLDDGDVSKTRKVVLSQGEDWRYSPDKL